MPDDRIEALEARVSSLETTLAELRRNGFATTGAPAPAKPSVVVRKRLQATDTSAIEQPPTRARTFNAEAFFGGRFLLGAGVLAFLLGVGFFLKYAFDNGWIGPTGRVAIGLLAGIAMILGAERIFRAGQRYYAEALSGLGAAILYLSLWAAGSYFHLVPLGAAFIAMIVVTAAVSAIAVKRDAQRLAFVALAGALLTPALNAGPALHSTALFGYLTVLNTALLWLTAKRWRALEAAAFAGTQLYLLSEFPRGVTQWSADTTTAVIFATIFFLQFAAAPMLRARRLPATDAFDIVMSVLAAGLYYCVLYAQLFTAHRHWLTAASVVVAIAYLAIARTQIGRMRQTAAALALAFITIGVGVTFTGSTMTLAWSIEGAALLIIGTRTQSALTRAFGYAAYVCMWLALESGLPGGPLFANPRFATLLLIGVGFAAVAWAARRQFMQAFSAERHLGEAAEAIAHFFVLLALGYELSTAFHDSPLAASLLMLVYAVLLVATGFMFKRDYTRWEGLVLFGALLVKVFLIDLASLDTVVRIVSFLAVGSVLLIVALLYQRAQARDGERA